MIHSIVLHLIALSLFVLPLNAFAVPKQMVPTEHHCIFLARQLLNIAANKNLFSKEKQEESIKNSENSKDTKAFLFMLNREMYSFEGTPQQFAEQFLQKCIDQEGFFDIEEDS